mgnify:FL=1
MKIIKVTLNIDIYRSYKYGGREMITKIIKRDGREANFDTEKITQAIYKAAQAIGGND